MRAVLIRGAGFAFLWWVLAEGRPEAWGLGLVAAVAGCVLSFRLLPPRREGISLAGLLAFAAFFLWHSARGGLQVAALALRPRPDLAPTLLELPLSLAPGAPRVLMTAAILVGTWQPRMAGRSVDRRNVAAGVALGSFPKFVDIADGCSLIAAGTSPEDCFGIHQVHIGQAEHREVGIGICKA